MACGALRSRGVGIRYLDVESRLNQPISEDFCPICTVSQTEDPNALA